MTPVDPELLRRVTSSLQSDLKPVRPIATDAALVVRLLVVFAAAALAGAAALGFEGVRLNPPISGAVLVCVLPLALIEAAAAASAMIPGSRWFPPAVSAIAGCVALAALLWFVLPDRGAGRFVPEGIACFTAGVVCAIFAASAAVLALWRGFAHNGNAAGLAIGALAGLAGLAMLELHCPNFRYPHVAVWHLAVVAVGAAAGYFFGSNRRAAELMQ